MNALLASTDPVLRDEVAYSAAERWILRDKRLAPAELRQVLRMWTANLDDGLGGMADDRVFKRSFSALCLSVVAAADLQAPFLEPAEARAFFDRLLDYFQRERDLRGFDAGRGWMHSVAHTADADGPALAAWVGQWVEAHRRLWANGPQVDAGTFARVENARQVLRSLHAALSMDAQPTPAGEAARQAVLAGLAKMR